MRESSARTSWRFKRYVSRCAHIASLTVEPRNPKELHFVDVTAGGAIPQTDLARDRFLLCHATRVTLRKADQRVFHTRELEMTIRRVVCLIVAFWSTSTVVGAEEKNFFDGTWEATYPAGKAGFRTAKIMIAGSGGTWGGATLTSTMAAFSMLDA